MTVINRRGPVASGSRSSKNNLVYGPGLLLPLFFISLSTCLSLDIFASHLVRYTSNYGSSRILGQAGTPSEGRTGPLWHIYHFQYIVFATWFVYRWCDLYTIVSCTVYITACHLQQCSLLYIPTFKKSIHAHISSCISRSYPTAT